MHPFSTKLKVKELSIVAGARSLAMVWCTDISSANWFLEPFRKSLIIQVVITIIITSLNGFVDVYLSQSCQCNSCYTGLM